MEIFGVPAGYTEQGDLPKAEIRLEIPGNDVLNLLKATHDVDRFGEWEEFITPYKVGDPPNDQQLVLREFILADVTKSNRTRFQIVETNESPILFTFGDQAKVYSYEFQILNGGLNLAGQDTEWIRRFEDFYERFNAVTIATYGLRLYVDYDREVHEVVWLTLDIRQSSESDVIATAHSQMYLVNKRRKRYTLGKRRSE